MVEELLYLLIIILALGLLWGLIKKVAAKAVIALGNSIAGLLILAFLNIYLGMSVPVNLATVIVCALFGLPGVGALVVLNYFTMI